MLTNGDRVYLVSDRRLCDGIEGLIGSVTEALESGVRFIQLREKDLEGAELLSLAVRLRRLTMSFGARLIINDRADIALLAEADGVHLGQNGISPIDARALLGHDRIIGVSTHGLSEALEAERDGADFITLGPIYFTGSKAQWGEPLGPGEIARVAEAVKIPVYAIGGIKRERIREAISSGAYGVALISAVFGSVDIKKSIRELLSESHKIN